MKIYAIHFDNNQDYADHRDYLMTNHFYVDKEMADKECAILSNKSQDPWENNIYTVIEITVITPKL